MSLNGLNDSSGGGGSGGGTIATITSTNGSVTVTHPSGPTTDLSVNGTPGFTFNPAGGAGGQPAEQTASGTDASINVELQGKGSGSTIDLLFGGGLHLQPTAGGPRYFDADGSKVDVHGVPIHNVTDPTLAQDAATKNYVDTHGGTGTVTNVTSSNGDVGITNPTTTPNLKVNGINGVNVAGAPSAGQVITAIDATHADWATPSTSPTGSAGGDLAGTYPNPTVANLHLAADTSIGHKLTNLTNGTAAQDAAAFGQIPTSLPPNGAAGGDLSNTYPNPIVVSTHLAAALPVTQGGTGDATLTAHGVLLGNGTSAINQVSGTGTSGQVLTSNGSGADPTWQNAGGGSSRNNIYTVTTTATLATADTGVLANATGGAFTVTLPASPGAGFVYQVKKIDATGNAVTIVGSSGNIDNSASIAISTQYASLSFTFDGTNWWIV